MNIKRILSALVLFGFIAAQGLSFVHKLGCLEHTHSHEHHHSATPHEDGEESSNHQDCGLCVFGQVNFDVYTYFLKASSSFAVLANVATALEDMVHSLGIYDANAPRAPPAHLLA